MKLGYTKLVLLKLSLYMKLRKRHLLYDPLQMLQIAQISTLLFLSRFPNQPVFSIQRNIAKGTTDLEINYFWPLKLPSLPMKQTSVSKQISRMWPISNIDLNINIDIDINNKHEYQV